MLFDYNYFGNSAVTTTGDSASISFAPDVSRSAPVSFRGELKAEHAVRFREAISALHDVVINDQRWVAKDRPEYKAWRALQDQAEMARYLTENEEILAQIDQKSAEILEMQRKVRRLESEDEYWDAVREYYNLLYTENRDAWFVLDPVITVHPENIFFECFSKDESSYGKLSCGYSLFEEESIADRQNGTTNIDYSQGLYDEFQKLRDYRVTKLEVKPEGFTLKTEGETDFTEVKIDLPDSWIRGFLQVSSAMALDTHCIRLHPQDVFMICQILKQRKDTVGGKALEFHLKKDQKVKIVFEPWNIELVCERSTYFGDTDQVIRVWGRRRLLILERLVSVAKHFDLHLVGHGMPYFIVADLDGLQFTLGLSGWSANNFSEGANFALLAPRGNLSDEIKNKVFQGLQDSWVSNLSDLAKHVELDETTVHTALMGYIQAGRVVYDIHLGVYQVRELTRDPLDMDTLRFSSPEEKEAMVLLEAEVLSKFKSSSYEVEVTQEDGTTKMEQRYLLTSEIQDASDLHEAKLVLNPNLSINRTESACTCHLGKMKFRSGLCRHILVSNLELNQRMSRGYKL